VGALGAGLAAPVDGGAAEDAVLGLGLALRDLHLAPQGFFGLFQALEKFFRCFVCHLISPFRRIDR
jgi:hypothetical protein